MTTMLDDTHDPALRSWVPSAHVAGTDFPIQNLPFGRFRRAGGLQPWRIGVAIGEQVLDLAQVAEQPGWTDEQLEWLMPLAQGEMNHFLAQGPRARRAVRALLSQGLREGS